MCEAEGEGVMVDNFQVKGGLEAVRNYLSSVIFKELITIRYCLEQRAWEIHLGLEGDSVATQGAGD